MPSSDMVIPLSRTYSTAEQAQCSAVQRRRAGVDRASCKGSDVLARNELFVTKQRRLGLLTGAPLPTCQSFIQQCRPRA